MMNFQHIFPILLLFLGLASSNNQKCLNDEYRPQFHFSPKEHWINDPNGMVYSDGEYHLFYQYHPYDTVWGPMYWGHAVSTDMSYWEELDIALSPDDLGTIFSGGGVVDSGNSSGWQTDPEIEPIVALYTSAGETQQQSVAFSNDRGRTFTKFEGNPVLPNPGIPDFRDPKVGRYYDRWIMSLAVQDRISFYESDDLKEWRHLSDFGQDLPPQFHGGVWECPDLLEMQFEGRTIWVLIVSINPGGPNQGSATLYFVGDFDGTTFTHTNGDEVLWVDWGTDNYAGVTFFNDPEGRYIYIGWMNNWLYANELPTQIWRGQMTLPRELRLINIDGQPRLAQLPPSESESLRNPQEFVSIVDSIEIPSGFYLIVNELAGFRNDLLEVSIDLDISNVSGDPAGRTSICFWNGAWAIGKPQICVRLNKENGEIEIDRGVTIDFHPNFPRVMTAKRAVNDGSRIDFKIYADKSSLEVFVDGGSTALTSLFFASNPQENIFDMVGVFHESPDSNSRVLLTGASVHGLHNIHGC